MIVNGEVGHLVLHDVVEDLRRREQQPPVEAHRPAGRTGGPAGALAPDLEAPVGGADPVDGRRQPGLDLSPGAAPIPALERSAQSRAIGARDGDVKSAGAAGDKSSRAPRVDPDRQRQSLAEVGHLAAVTEPGRGRLGLELPKPAQVRSIQRRFSSTKGSTSRSGKRRGTTTSTPSPSTRIRACRARGDRRMR